MLLDYGIVYIFLNSFAEFLQQKSKTNYFTTNLGKKLIIQNLKQFFGQACYMLNFDSLTIPQSK